MKRRNISGLCLLTCILLFGNAGRAVGQKPIPRDKMTPNEVTFKDDTLKFWRRDIDAYCKYTKDPKSIQPLAKVFLKDVQLRFVRVRFGPTSDELRKVGYMLFSKGCRDPLVRSYWGAVSYSYKGTNFEESWRELRMLYKSFADSDYPPECRWRLLSTIYWFGWIQAENYKYKPMEWPELRKETLSLAVSFVGDKTIDLEGQRVLLYELLRIFDFFGGRNREDIETFYKACAKQPKANPWTFNMIAGFHYYTLAWYHRGKGDLSKTTPEGIRLFRENLGKAAEHFEKAYELRPEFPEAAAEMISVAMYGDSDLTPREWFDRAAAAQMDYSLMYDKMMWALNPRQGDNREKMYRFVCECADTERYDTIVPLYYIMHLHTIDRDMKFNGEVWKRPGVYARVKRILEGMAHDPAHADSQGGKWQKSNLLTMHVALAGRVGEYADARRLLDKMDEHCFNSRVFNFWCRQPGVTFGRIYAFTGGGAKYIKKALKLLDLGPKPPSDAMLREARNLFQKAHDADNNAWSRAFCQRKLDEINEYFAFNAGQWVNKKFDAGLILWNIVDGQWRVIDDHSAEGYAYPPCSSVFLQPAVLPPIPLEIEFETKLSVLPELGTKLFMGLCVPQRDQKDIIHRFYMSAESSKVGVEIMGKTKEIALGLYQTNHFRIKLADGRAVFYVNDELCFDHSDKDFRPSSNLQLGCYDKLYPIFKVTISNVRIRKWDPTKEPTKEPAKEKETP